MGRPAARLTDMHVCPMVTGVVPHLGGPITSPGALTVLIGGLPAARVGDMATCTGPPDFIAPPCAPTVLIGGRPAARLGDMTVHGGSIIFGCFSVLIGTGGAAGSGLGGGGSPDTTCPGDCMIEAKRTGLPFVELKADQAGGEKGPLTPEEAQALFEEMAAQEDIAFEYPRDGCYARAHLMTHRMQNSGITPGKAWTFSSNFSEDPLWVETPNDPSGKVRWSYHVAPTVPVQGKDGTVSNMVIDPSMFDRPVTVDEWRDAQHDSPVVRQTNLGEAPFTGMPGSGYWPGQDPEEGVDAHARRKMRDYGQEVRRRKSQQR